MYLKSLELSGFKSFAKQGELSFTTPVTAIVGPNGSGKSNVAESFRFALGEQSVKSLRSKKTEDLIWNGSNALPRANRASVKVTFDNTKRLLDIDFDEVTIERIVHRDGASEYRLNDSGVRLKDIVEVLAKANIGASGHHIISQGEADRVLNANPRERREMVEDALGLRVFQYKKTESLRKLEKTEENKKQVEALEREHAPHMRFLERQMDKLAKARELRDRLTSFYQDYLKREELYLTYQEEVLKGEREEPERELEKITGELTQVRSLIAESSKNDAESQELLALDEQLSKARTAKDELSRALGRIEGQLQFEESRKATELSRMQTSGAPIPKNEVDTVFSSISQNAEAIENTTSIDEAKRAAGEIKTTISRFSAAHVDRTGEIEAEFAAIFKKLNDERQQLEVRVREGAEAVGAIESSVRELKARMESRKDGQRSAERRMFEIMGRQQELRSILSIIDSKRAALARDRDDYTRELTEAAALVGKVVLGFSDYEPTEEGRVLSLDELQDEEREVQLGRRRELEKLKIRLEELGGGSAGEIEKEFTEAQERSAFLAREIADLEASAASLRNLIADLEVEIDRKFREGIEQISHQFEEFFVLMFGGGNAGLLVVKEKKKKGKLMSLLTGEFSAGADEEEGESGEEGDGVEGVDISVALPGKRVKGLMMLSGGERALTSIALIFAMSQVNPPPFIILDETDAALDEANSRRYGDLIELLSQKSQLIVITHNRETMSRAGVLYGITMGAEGASKLLSVKFDEAVAVAK